MSTFNKLKNMLAGKPGEELPPTSPPPSPFDVVADIREFHVKFGQAYDGPPRELDFTHARFRLDTLKEEVREYEEAHDKWIETGNPVFLEKMLDALVDLAYFAVGTAHQFGWDFREAWKRVHAANMMKELAGDPSKSKRGFAMDVVKPQGWTPPSHHDLVKVEVTPEPTTADEHNES